mgnify:CR=1 FL=1
MAIDYANVGNNTSICIIDRVEDEGTCWCFWISYWCWNQINNLIEELCNPITSLTGDAKNIFNKDYLSTCDGFYCYYGDQRSVVASATYKF